MVIYTFPKIMLLILFSVSTKMVPRVPTKIGLNIKNHLRVYPAGIPIEQIPHLYKVCIHIYTYVCIFRPVYIIPIFFNHILIYQFINLSISINIS
jgi:hypothetical protein